MKAEDTREASRDRNIGQLSQHTRLAMAPACVAKMRANECMMAREAILQAQKTAATKNCHQSLLSEKHHDIYAAAVGPMRVRNRNDPAKPSCLRLLLGLAETFLPLAAVVVGVKLP